VASDAQGINVVSPTGSADRGPCNVVIAMNDRKAITVTTPS